MKNLNANLEPLFSKFSDIVCSMEEVHSSLRSSKLISILSKASKEESEKIINEWLSQFADAITIFNKMKAELNQLINPK